MNKDKLIEILRRHELWLRNEDGGEQADLRGANLYRANLCDADLGGANLYRANLCNADLNRANLGGADLGGANLYRANLCDANLYRANLCDANLGGADLFGANLGGANLCDANLFGANLGGANLCDANLCGADLFGANLCDANLGDLHIYQLSRIGSAKRSTMFWADENKIWCGCFVGTFAEWRDKIRETYSDGMCEECPGKVKYRKQYEAALAYFAELAAIDGMPQYKELLEGAK